MSVGGGGGAARAYRDVVEQVRSAAAAVRERDARRAAELERILAEREARLARAQERAALTRAAVELRWEAALELLWAESWMTLRPHPAPDPRADPAALDALDAEVERAAAALEEAVRRRLRLPGR